MMKKLTMALAAVVAWTGLAETVTNVRGTQREKSNLVDIYYDLEADAGNKYTVEVKIEGKTDEVSATTFSGDVGDGISPGQNLHIVWDAGADWPKKKGDVKAVVTATKCDGGQDGGHDKVQLWEDGPYWATTNIGADNPWESGLYFWWGDTTGHRPSGTTFDFSFYWSNCLTIYKGRNQLQSEGWITSNDVLAPEHDAAHIKWGGSWRMPTHAEFYAILNKCDWTWTTTNGVNGYCVRGRGDFDANSIFFPCAGGGIEASLCSFGSYGAYWSSVPNPESMWYSCYLYLYDNSKGVNCLLDREHGNSIRPVQGFATTDSSMWFHVDTADKCDFKICLHGNGGVLDVDGELVEVVTNAFNYNDRQVLPKFTRGSNKLLGWQLGTAAFDWTGENYKGEPYSAEDDLIPDQEEIIWNERYIKDYAADGDAWLDDDGVMVVRLYAIWTTTVQLNFANTQSTLVSWPQLRDHLIWWCGYHNDSLKDGMSVELAPGEHDVYAKATGAYSWCYDVFRAVNDSGDSLEGNQNTVPWSYKLLIPSEAWVFQGWDGTVAGRSIHINVQVASSHVKIGYVSFHCAADAGRYAGKAGFTPLDLSRAKVNILSKKTSQDFDGLSLNGVEAKELFPLPVGEYTVEYGYVNDLEYGVEWTPYLASESVAVAEEEYLSKTVEYVPFGGRIAYCVTLDSNGGDDDVSYRWFKRDFVDPPAATIYLPSPENMKRASATAGQQWVCDGWWNGKSGGRQYQSGDRIDGDICLYAHWRLFATTGVLTSFDPGEDAVITLSQTFEYISANAFELAGNVKEVVFEGDAPQLEEGALDGLPLDCTIRVSPQSSGWGVTIPGTWHGLRIEYVEESFATEAEFTVENGVLTAVELNEATSVTTPSGVTSIGDYAFENLDTLESVTISEGVTSIGEGAFSGCSALARVDIPASVTEVDPWAFDHCSSLVKITVAKDNPSFKSVNGMLLTKDGKKILQGVNGKVVVPPGVEVIGDSAFYGLTGLTSVTIPNGVGELEEYAFGRCDGLSRIVIPGSVTNIAYYALGGCGNLVSIEVAAGNEVYCSKNGMLLTKDGTFLLQGVNGNVTIPPGIQMIGESAFESLGGFASVTIPDGVTHIGDYAFSYCNELAHVMIPDGVIFIGEEAFYGCSALTRVTIPASVDSVGYHAFAYDYELAEANVPRHLEEYVDDSEVFYGGSDDLQIDYYDYIVRFHKNDASNDAAAEQLMDAGTATRLTSLNSLGWAKRGLDFVGWGKYPNSTVVWKSNWANVTDLAYPGETVDLYAMWAVKPGGYAIEFVRNDGAGTWRTVGFNYGEKTRMPSVANGLQWARRGYDFKGWALTTADANAGKVWKGDWAYVATPVKAGEVLTVYAVWALKPGFYQIRFNKNDGTGKWRTLGFECDKSTKLSTIAGLGWERPGYQFKGWASNKANADAGKVWKPDGAWVTNATAEGRTLSIYAIWE